MAGNKNPWRDIVSPAEWQSLKTSAATEWRAVTRPTAATTPTQSPGGFVFGRKVKTRAEMLMELEGHISSYDQIQKDDSAKFAQRAGKLKIIAMACDRYAQVMQAEYAVQAKTAPKQTHHQLHIWINSIGNRALKKAEYLRTLSAWHQTAKAKYRDRIQLSLYLRDLAADHTRDNGEKLHATGYATMEKIDPLHRQAFVFMDEVTPGVGQAYNNHPMGRALLAYLAGDAAAMPNRGTNANASFYEWLEYHPFCIGTPVVTAGADQYKNKAKRVTYEGLDLGFVYVEAGQMQYERVVSATPKAVLNTTDFPPSGKGHPGAVAFVWDADQNLWLHQHGSEGFVHASAKQGRKIRCSGMMNAANGKLTRISNESGHYAPTAESLYHFLDWLEGRGCLEVNSAVQIMHQDGPITPGLYKMHEFLAYFDNMGKRRAIPLPYPAAKPAHIP